MVYQIPIVYQKIVYHYIDADNLQEAVEGALKEFFETPEEGYLEDSFEVDDIVRENYNEAFDINKALENT